MSEGIGSSASKGFSVRNAVLILLLVLSAIYLFQIFGGSDPLVSRIPADVQMYVGVNNLEIQSEDMQRILRIFQNLAGGASMTPVKVLDDALSSYDIRFEQDILPWIGQYAGFAMRRLDPNQSGGPEFMLILQSRDNRDSDIFLNRLAATMERQNGWRFDLDSSGRDVIYSYRAQQSWQDDIVLARMGSLLYLSNSMNMVREAGDLRQSSSLASMDGYKNAVSQLPRSRAATLYIGEGFFDFLYEEMLYSIGGIMPVGFDSDLDLLGMAVSLTAKSEGLSLDAAIVHDPANLSDLQRSALDTSYAAPTTDRMVSGNTLMYIGANASQASRGRNTENLLTTNEMRDALALLRQQTGLDVERLLESLGSEFAVAIAPAQSGLIPTAIGMNIGVTLLGTATNSVVLTDSLGGLVQMAGDEMLLPLTTRSVQLGGYNLTQVFASDQFQSIDFLVYGADRDYFFISTSADMLATGLEGRNTLADNPRYQNTWRAFNARSVPYMYVDLNGLSNLLINNGMMAVPIEVQQTLRRLPTLAAAINPTTRNTQSFTIVLFVD